MTDTCGRSSRVADDDEGRRVLAGASTEFGTTSEAAGGVSGGSIGGASATTFGGGECKAGIRLSSTGAAACEVTSALRCSRSVVGIADCLGRDSNTGNTGRSEGLNVALSLAGVWGFTSLGEMG